MRNLLVAFSILTFTVPAALPAQEPPPKPKVVSPTPKRPLMQRIFGGKKETPAPVATPVSTPTPKPKPVAKATPRPKARTRRTPAAETQPPAPKKEETSRPAKTEPPAPANEAPAAAPDAPQTTPPAETKASTKKATKETAKKTAPPKPNTEGMDDATKFQAIKAAAQEDPAIQALKEKADSAISDSDAHAASLAYNRALFRKVRELDPTLGEYVAAMEGAMMKLLTAEKKAQ